MFNFLLNPKPYVSFFDFTVEKRIFPPLKLEGATANKNMDMVEVFLKSLNVLTSLISCKDSSIFFSFLKSNIFLNTVPQGENWPASIEPYVAFL